MIDEQLGHPGDGPIVRFFQVLYILIFIGFLVLFVLCVSQGPIERREYGAEVRHEHCCGNSR